MSSSDSSEIVDKEHLYGDFRAGERRRQKRQDTRDRLWMKLVHKSYDLAPEDEDMGDFYADNRRIGMGPWPAVALAGIIAATGIGGAWIGHLWSEKEPPPPPQQFEDTDTNTKYEWGFEAE